MNTNPIALTIAAGLSGMIASQAHAQWSSDSTIHQVVADGPGEQVQPHIVPTIDGGCYVSWFSSQSGYDVRLQRLDPAGNEMWAHNGILIADRNFSSTQSYDLATDGNDALLVFRDDRFGGTKITAQRIKPDGTTAWGANGIQFGNGTDFVASPDIATTDDGFAIIGWVNANETHLAKISVSGMTMWTTALTNPGGEAIVLASMHQSDGNSVIVSWVQYAAFFDPKHMYAQKILADGSEGWASRAAVLDGGSLQFGNFPEFVSDGAGGAVFSWYDTSAGLNVYAQHLNSDGSERYTHNGVLASSFPAERVAPTATYDLATDSVYVAWVELASNQSQSGVYAQRLDSTGTRMWTERGYEVSAVDTNESGSINAQFAGGNLVTLWTESAGGFGQDQNFAHAITPAGTNAWTGGTVDLASNINQYSRLKSALSTNGFIIAGWQVGGFGVADIQTHNINTDGTLGVTPCPADLNGDLVLNFFDISAFLNAFGAQNPIADFNYDGMYNFFDISAFLNAFGAGCP